MSQLVTGDAVVLGLRPARLPSRALAVFIDLVVLWGVYLALSMALLSATGSLDDAATAAIAVALLLLVLIGGPVAVETLSHGRSLGKMACGLRVVREDGGPIRFRHALVRGALGFVEIQMTVGVVACIASLVSARGRRLGDVFAGTLVVRERVPVSRPVPVPPPPPWVAGHFAGLDLSRVPDGLWLAVRQYLLRADQLDPQVGWSMAQRLAADVASFTGAPVPEGMPPGVYLSGVVAERQGREAQRAFGGGVGPETGRSGAVPAPNAPGAGAGPVSGPGTAWSAPLSAAAPPAVPPAPAPSPPRPSAGGGGDGGGGDADGPRTGFVPPA
ncbi:RDD family protein [Streptomyces verrucosisporus]|uniref:RDD family protein n=1 Tax=Streptomyces verrucosisporus TaxID=1695161 RepID=UPI0019CF93B0|nr:RDD family protein [Streptomyces verrucosisporus]MBN3933281.1 RDD family protein [Streptomyces verrucosisporus]